MRRTKRLKLTLPEYEDQVELFDINNSIDLLDTMPGVEFIPRKRTPGTPKYLGQIKYAEDTGELLVATTGSNSGWKVVGMEDTGWVSLSSNTVTTEPGWRIGLSASGRLSRVRRIGPFKQMFVTVERRTSESAINEDGRLEPGTRTAFTITDDRFKSILGSGSYTEPLLGHQDRYVVGSVTGSTSEFNISYVMVRANANMAPIRVGQHLTFSGIYL